MIVDSLDLAWFDLSAHQDHGVDNWELSIFSDLQTQRLHVCISNKIVYSEFELALLHATL